MQLHFAMLQVGAAVADSMVTSLAMHFQLCSGQGMAHVCHMCNDNVSCCGSNVEVIAKQVHFLC